MTDDEFDAACDAVMNLIEADGASANIAEHTVSIDFHDWQVTHLLAILRAGPCPTLCDVDCEADCHELHQRGAKQRHRPEDHS